MKIDWWTLGIQTVNVAVLIWLLARYFWRPMAAIIAQRREAAQHMLGEAAAARQAAAAALAEIERTRAGFAQEREAVLREAHAAAEQARAATLAAATQDVAALQSQGRAALEAERLATQSACAAQASTLAVDIARRLAARLQGPAVDAAFLAWLIQEIRALPQPVRQQGGPLQVLSAAPLAPAVQAEAAAQIIAALGAPAELTFITSPALIAGLELRGNHLMISNSWRADLACIAATVSETMSGGPAPPPQAAAKAAPGDAAP